MPNKNESHNEKEESAKDRIAAAIFAALVQHGTIPHKRPKQIYVKKESEWKKRRISGLR